MTRRDAESAFGRFWRYEINSITLVPVNPQEPRLGGKVTAKVRGFDFRTFTPYTKSYFGVYGEDFLTFGQYAEGNPLENEDRLLKIFDNENQSVVDKHCFKFSNNRVHYSRSVNGETQDEEIEHSI